VPGLFDPCDPPPTDRSSSGPPATSGDRRLAGSGEPRPLAVLDRSFRLLVCEPAPLALDGFAVDGLPDRPIPPAGAPERLSWHGVGHTVGFVVANVGMVVGCLVFARRFAAHKQWGWVAACVATTVAVLVLILWPDTEGVSVRLVVASAILFGFVAALAARLLRGLPDAAGTAGAGRWATP
jgi:hypothetical protein